MFTSQFFTGNRQKLQQTAPECLIVLTANGVLQRSADTTFAFRQDSNFWYLTGVNEPDFILVCHYDQSFLIMPRRSEHRDLWDGAVDLDSIKETSGITEIYDHHEGWNKLDRLIKQTKRVHTIAPVEAYFDSFGFYANPARGALLATIKKHRNIELVDIRKPLARLRQIKQQPELEALQRAIDITGETLQQVIKNLKSYKNEFEIVADITAGYIKLGAAGHAYQPIVASGINAATIHYMRCDDKLDMNQLLLLDVGAEFQNYSADISRTWALSEPTARQKSVYDAVARVQQAAFKLLKPGVNFRAYEQQVDELMAVELKKLGLIKDVTDKKKLKKYYPHLASHFLGLDTHDAADYDMPLAPGMVLTVEPGIYIPEESIGVRIEDNVLVTANGNKVLSANIPTNLI